MNEHRIRTWADPFDEDRAYWECDCGCGGSAPAWKVDLASDKHIGPDEHRIDVSGGAS